MFYKDERLAIFIDVQTYMHHQKHSNSKLITNS